MSYLLHLLNVNYYLNVLNISYVFMNELYLLRSELIALKFLSIISFVVDKIRRNFDDLISRKLNLILLNFEYSRD